MRRRTQLTLLIVAIAAALLAGLVFLWRKAPPEAARLLPESDAIVYINLEPIRVATRFDQHPVPHDAAYQQFIDATGFVFERDLREAAFALHRMDNPLGPNGPVAFSEVFAGRFDGKRLQRYLQSISTAQDQYAGHTVYAIPSQGRTVRVALLGYDMVAVSNTPTPEQIHSILDRYRTAALPFSGSSTLERYYGQVPAFSLAWAIGRISLPLAGNGGPSILGLHIPLGLNTAFIASLRWLGSLRLRIEEIAPNAPAATASVSAIRAITSLLATAENNLPAPMTSPDYRDLLNSIAVEQHGDRALITATIPLGLLEKTIAPAAGFPSLPAPRNPPPAQPRP
jgi:hypothetical protein